MMLPSFKIVPFLSLLMLALANYVPKEPINANAVPAFTSTAPRLASIFSFETAVPTNIPVAHIKMCNSIPLVMSAATMVNGEIPANHVQALQCQEYHAPVIVAAPVAAPTPAVAKVEPEAIQDGSEPTWMFFPRPQNVNMTPEQEQE
ncbi:hypothetical protein GGF37_004415 [Kickxella alabastrina]|nr:hypothetical protein GGF37_004415 [Kickxella alabastrina]